MKSYGWGLVLGILIIILVEGCLNSEQSNSYAKSPLYSKDMFTDCDNKKDESSKNLCYSVMAIQNKDKQICYNIKKQDALDECLSGVSAKVPDLTICTDIVTQDYKNNCFFNCAVGKSDSNLCEQITNKNFSTDCLAKVKKDPTICSTLEGNRKSDCERIVERQNID
jgi:hypothetical protein